MSETLHLNSSPPVVPAKAGTQGHTYWGPWIPPDAGMNGLRNACAAIIIACASTAALAQTPPPAQQPPAQPQKLTIGFVDIDGDPRYEPIRGFERLIIKTREHPFVGAQVGIDEAQPLTRILKTDFALERITVKSSEE